MQQVCGLHLAGHGYAQWECQNAAFLYALFAGTRGRESLPRAAALCVLCAALCLVMLGGWMRSGLACSPLHHREFVKFIECRHAQGRSRQATEALLSGPLQNTPLIWREKKLSHQ